MTLLKVWQKCCDKEIGSSLTSVTAFPYYYSSTIVCCSHPYWRLLLFVLARCTFSYEDLELGLEDSCPVVSECLCRWLRAWAWAWPGVRAWLGMRHPWIPFQEYAPTYLCTSCCVLLYTLFAGTYIYILSLCKFVEVCVHEWMLIQMHVLECVCTCVCVPEYKLVVCFCIHVCEYISILYCCIYILIHVHVCVYCCLLMYLQYTYMCTAFYPYLHALLYT